MVIIFTLMTVGLVAFFFLNFIDTAVKVSIYLNFEPKINYLIHAMMESALGLFFALLAKWMFDEAGTLIYAQGWKWLLAACIFLYASLFVSVALLISRAIELIHMIDLRRKLKREKISSGETD